MTQEDKQLLLQDLCARLPYGVKLKIRQWTTPVEVTIIKHSVLSGNYIINENYRIDDIKPYLRPMSSMTEEEKKEFDNFCVIDEFVWNGNAEIGYKNQAIIMSHAIDWLNKNMFDYRGLIPKGRAIEVTENNNPYKD